MENLTLEHLVGYLPYGLKGKSSNGLSNSIDEVIGHYSDFNLTLKAIVNNHNSVDYGCDIEDFKPILRPLSDLTKEITHNRETFVPIVKLAKMRSGDLSKKIDKAFDLIKVDILTKRLPYDMMQKLQSWHFDIFNLIDKNLAIDINTL